MLAARPSRGSEVLAHREIPPQRGRFADRLLRFPDQLIGGVLAVPVAPGARGYPGDRGDDEAGDDVLDDFGVFDDNGEGAGEPIVVT